VFYKTDGPAFSPIGLHKHKLRRNNMSKKIVLYLSWLLILTVVLVACGGDEGGGEAASAEKVNVRMGTWAGVEEAAELQAIIDEVNANSDTYQIIHEPQPADYYTKLQTSLTGCRQ
jgi:multiple sugar transport system substrate-binding protein